MLVTIEPHDEYDVRRWACASGKAHLLIYRVLYGYRLRACDSQSVYEYPVDWCMGAVDIDGEFAVWLRTSLATLIESNVAGGRPLFEGIPANSRVRPVHLDQCFVSFIKQTLELIHGQCDASPAVSVDLSLL